MLVLSRGKNDKVVFPSLGISVEIVRISGSKVRLGIDAPSEVPVLRHEIATEWHSGFDEAGEAEARRRELNHQIRNRLNAATLGLHLIHRKLEIGETEELEAEVFRILNELKALEDETSSPRPRPEKKSASTASRALVVEDDDNERELLSGLLKMSGFEVATAMDGLQAMVQLARDERPDIVLLDMHMPRFDGSRTVSAIRENPDYRDLKVFAISGADRNELNVTVGPRGVNRWFAKPLDPRSLMVAIEEELQTDAISA
ncbi:MAG: response regulator [Pirellulales bacterium]|nr:response regulator [Planctomycetales bacterium]